MKKTSVLILALSSGCATIPPATPMPFAPPAVVYQNPRTEVVATAGGDTLGMASLVHVRPMSEKQSFDIAANVGYSNASLQLGYWRRRPDKGDWVRSYRFGLTGGAGASFLTNVGLLLDDTSLTGNEEMPTLPTVLQSVPDSIYLSPSTHMQWTIKRARERTTLYTGLSLGVPLNMQGDFFAKGSANASLSFGVRVDKDALFYGVGFQSVLLGIPLPMGVLGYRF